MTNNDIRALRDQLKLTQAKFAKLLGVTTVTFNRWESGRIRPTEENIMQMKKIKEEKGL